MEDLEFGLMNPEEKNLGQVFGKYFQYWPLFIIGTIVCLTAVFLYLRYWSQTRYEIQSTILLKNKSVGKSIGEMDNFSNLGLIKTSQSLEDEIGILTSSGLMEEVISKNAFNITFYEEGNIRDVEIYGENVPVQILVDETIEHIAFGLPIYLTFLDSERYELRTVYNEEEIRSEHSLGDLVTLPYGTFTIVPKVDASNVERTPPLFFVIGDKDKYVNGFLGDLSVMPDNETGSLLRLNFIASHKKKGEDVLSELIETYIEKTINYENELAENTIKMIDNRLKLLSGEIEEVEKTVADFKTKKCFDRCFQQCG